MKAGLALSLIVSLAACGRDRGGTDNFTTANGALAGGNAMGATVTVPAVAEQSTPACPTPSPAPGLDIVGIHVGMSADEAFQRVVCAAPNLQIAYRSYSSNPYDYVSRPYPADTRDFIETRVSNGVAPDSFRVQLAGRPGQEQVVAILREMNFAPGTEPTIATLEAELRRKYGLVNGLPPEQRLRYGFAATGLVGADGRASAGQIEYRCTARDTSGPPRLDCPYFVIAEVRPRPDNPELAKEMRVEISSGPHAARMAAAYNTASTAAAERQRAEERAAANRRPAPGL